MELSHTLDLVGCSAQREKCDNLTRALYCTTRTIPGSCDTVVTMLRWARNGFVDY